MANTVTVLRALMLCIIILPLSTGCHLIHYNKVETGEIRGKLRVEWFGPDSFVFIPSADPDCKFSFVRSNGNVIEPKLMFTDAGSIPRVLRADRAYSPWGYAPAFIIHDWLFDAHKRGDGSEADYTFEEAALIMSEVTKTLMETKIDGERLVPRNMWAMYTQYVAVKSPVARKLWNGRPNDIPGRLCDETLQDIQRLLATRPAAVPPSLRTPLLLRLQPPSLSVPPSDPTPMPPP